MRDHGRIMTWLEWNSIARATQVTPARFMLEHNTGPPSDNEQYPVLTQDNREEGDDGVISCWSEDNGDWFLNEAGRDFPNEGELLYDITEVIRVWEPLKDED